MSEDPTISAELLGEILQKAISDHGFKMPIRVAVVASNRSVLVGSTCRQMIRTTV